MVTCQSANQLKTPAKISWDFKMVSQFGSLGDTIMGKTADLTVVQKTIIDILHKEGKTQTFITKEAGCSQSAVSKHVNRKLSGRKKCGWKRCTANRENRSIMRIVKQNRFKNLSELHKEWTEAGVKASRAPHTDVSMNLATVVVRGVLPGLRRRRTGLLPSGPKSSFQMRASFVFHLETKVLESGGRVEKHFMLPSADQLFKDADFIFQQDLAPAHTAKSTKSCLNDHGVGVLDWPANSPDLNPIENLRGIVKRKMRNKRPKTCRWPEGHCQRNLGFHTTSAVPQTDHLHATPNWGSN